MFKDKLNTLKNFIQKKTDGNNKKNIENLVVFLVLLVITIIAINVIWGSDKKQNSDTNDNTEYKQLAQDLDNELISNSNISVSEEYNLENKLEDILSKMTGVGTVKVLITYSETSQVVAMYNETYNSSNTEETDSNGGSRNISETDVKKEIIFEQTNGESKPVTERVIMPKIEGAIITAKGASDAVIKTNIVQAVAAVTGLPTYKVQVFEMDE